jgi:hypothetical protein
MTLAPGEAAQLLFVAQLRQWDNCSGISGTTALDQDVPEKTGARTPTILRGSMRSTRRTGRKRSLTVAAHNYVI